MRLDATGYYLSHHLMHMQSTEETRGAEENTVLIDSGRRAAADRRLARRPADLHTMAAGRPAGWQEERQTTRSRGARRDGQMDGLGAG